jgi:2-C-methyl-D-erythritol 4-phosphate cytidylyltransferase
VPTSVLLLASGSSSRMRAGGVEERKVWLPLAGRTVLEHALLAFEAVAEVVEIVVAVHPDDLARAAALQGRAARPVRVVAGGAARMDSAGAALAAVQASSTLVAIHDAARPLVQPAVVARVLAAAAEHGAAIAARRVHDTIKRSLDGRLERETLDRESLWAAQTPQAFERARYASLVARAAAEGWTPTDDAALWERWVGPVRLVDGGSGNIKLTTREDLLLAEAMLAARGAGQGAHEESR